jgi:hypothetical protein
MGRGNSNGMMGESTTEGGIKEDNMELEFTGMPQEKNKKENGSMEEG